MDVDRFFMFQVKKISITINLTFKIEKKKMVT